MSHELVRKYVRLDDEIDMRVRYKKILDMYGQVGLAQVIGEIGACLQIALDVMEGK